MRYSFRLYRILISSSLQAIAFAAIVLSMQVPVLAESSELSSFQSAVPVWPEGREKEMNLFVGFTAVFEKPEKPAEIHVAASTHYKIYLNGEFLGEGPARGAHGYFRLDRWPLSENCVKAQNIVAIEVAGYNVNSFYLLDQPSFLQAEIVSGNNVIAATGTENDFKARILDYHLQKVQRYSFQRPFIEYYQLKTDSLDWKVGGPDLMQPVKCSAQPSVNLLTRRVGYPEFNVIRPNMQAAAGEFRQNMPVEKLWKDRSLVNIGTKLKGYIESQLEVVPSNELQKVQTTDIRTASVKYNDGSTELCKGEFSIYDLATNLTGFPGLNIECEESVRVYLTFDEILQNNDVNFRRLGCVNAIGLELEPGSYRFESFEPYTMRYLKVMVMSGKCRVSNIYLRELANDEADIAAFDCEDKDLVKIFEAARQTFRQNATDLFMDCPSRERAGWLCDSYFTARVALDLTGNTSIETNMFENYQLPESFAHIPDGMLPMCYPSDHNDGVFIPNWAMWFVVQLKEYYQRSDDRQMVDELRVRIMALLKYFEQFENESGLLEKLPGWVFVEWSAANSFVQDVNYPSNMLYAAVLDVVGELYGQPEISAKAARVRRTILEQSYDGEFFIDNAVRKDGKLEVTGNKTEVCQYFAMYFGLVSPESHPELWQKLNDEFGPGRKENNRYPKVHMANAFVGNYLRLELLSRYGNITQLKDELAGYFLYMADQTGTLWENIDAYASCNHGFASHVAHCIYRDILGVSIDRHDKIISLTLRDLDMRYCSGSIPVEEGMVKVKWTHMNGQVKVESDIPEGYKLTVINLTDSVAVK